jgi:hypothetical protein
MEWRKTFLLQAYIICFIVMHLFIRWDKDSLRINHGLEAFTKLNLQYEFYCSKSPIKSLIYSLQERRESKPSRFIMISIKSWNVGTTVNIAFQLLIGLLAGWCFTDEVGRMLSCPPGFHSHCDLPHPYGMSFKEMRLDASPGPYSYLSNLWECFLKHLPPKKRLTVSSFIIFWITFSVTEERILLRISCLILSGPF